MKIKIFGKMMWHGILGILHEVMLSLVFIFLGFLVCFFWWGLIR
jgi:hypothetical protein